MKAKPIIIIFSILLLVTVVAIIVRSRNMAKPQQGEVAEFLKQFDSNLKAGNTDSLRNDFEIPKKLAVLTRLINVLANKTGFKGNEPPLFKLALDIDHSDIRILNNEMAQALIPVNFTSDSAATKISVLKLKVHKISAHNYKIVQVDANKLISDYSAYNSLIKSKTLTDKDLYSEATLKAFETSAQLKKKYDTVIWFSHFNNKTYFYVVKGKWDMDLDIYHYKDTVIGPYKMGLVGPDMKEIIPPDYDLIHTIGATFPGLVEVEKDSKKGLYDLEGKNVLPAIYDELLPVEDQNNLAVLRNGNDYFYLKKDMSVSDKTDLKVADFFPKVKKMRDSYNLYKNALEVVTEYNSRENHEALYIPPSYLVDLNLIRKVEGFKNPLRKIGNEETNIDYNVDFSNNIKSDNNWLEASFYSIRNYFLGGREEFYDKKNIVIVDAKRNRLFAQEIRINYMPEEGPDSLENCDINAIKVINDSLYEVRAGATLWFDLYDSTKTLTSGTYYHYLAIKNNKLVELRDSRIFGFTKYMKMDDSYLDGCYTITVGTGYENKGQTKKINHLTPELLRYMKNEIYADYGYQFKDKRWMAVFQDMDSYGYDQATKGPKKPNVSVDDSLTDIDKYNINWINQKLKAGKPNTLAAK